MKISFKLSLTHKFLINSRTTLQRAPAYPVEGIYKGIPEYSDTRTTIILHEVYICSPLIPLYNECNVIRVLEISWL